MVLNPRTFTIFICPEKEFTMYKISRYLCLVPFLMVLFTVFILKPGSIETSKVWIYISFSLTLISTVISYYIHKNAINFNIVDWLFLLFYTIGLVVSSVSTATHYVKLEIFTLLIVLYFCFRIFLSQNNFNSYWLSIIYVSSILMYSLYGFLQHINIIQYNSYPEKMMSGNFVNPGLYAGYLVIALPLIIDFIYKDSIALRRRYSANLIPFYFRCVLSSITMVFIVFILFNVDKRATIISVLISLPTMFLGIKKKVVKKLFFKNRYLSYVFIFLFFCIVGATSIRLYNQKLGSSQVRFKIGLITLNSISNDLIGKGIGCFPEGYTQEQIKYNQAQKKDSEKLNFITPYAYNEFLQIAVEFGVLGSVVFLLIICSTVYKGFSYRNYGYVGSLIALQVFSSMWYPYLFIAFIICLLFYIANSTTRYKKNSSRRVTIILLVVLTVVSITCVKFGMSRFIAYQKLDKLTNNPLEIKVDKYEELYPSLQGDTRFLMNYAILLTANANYDRSIDVLNRLKCIYSKREVFLALSKNNLLLGDTMAAEKNILNYCYLNPLDRNTNYAIADFYLRIGDVEKSEDCINIIKKTDTVSYTIKSLEEQLYMIKTKPD